MLLSFVYWAFHHDKRNKHHVYLFYILALNLTNELLSTLLKLLELPLQLSASFYNVVHCMLWLSLLSTTSGRRKTGRRLIKTYLAFCVFDFIVLEPGLHNFKVYSLVIGAVMYTYWMIADSMERLKSEDLAYFSSNTYTLLSAPIVFFVGFSLLMGFKLKGINTMPIYGVPFFTLVCYFVNAVYYITTAIFMYREKQRHDGT